MSIPLKVFSENIDPFCNQLIHVWNHCESGTKAAYGDLKLMETFLADNKFKEVNADSIIEFITYLRIDRNNAPESANRKISTIRRYIKHLRFSSVEGAFNINIEDLKSVRTAYSGPFQTLTPDEVQRIFDQIDIDSVMGYRDHVAYSLMYRLGMRIGEVHRLTLDDINMKENLITVQGKGRKIRVLPLVNDMPELIAKLLVLRQTWYGASRNESLFLSKKGKPLAIRTLQENFQKLVKAAGKMSLDKVTPHTLRHAFASHALEDEKIDLLVLKTIMGHKYLSTLEIYIHPSVEVQRRVVNDHVANEILGGLAENAICFSRFQPIRKAI